MKRINRLLNGYFGERQRERERGFIELIDKLQSEGKWEYSEPEKQCTYEIWYSESELDIY